MNQKIQRTRRGMIKTLGAGITGLTLSGTASGDPPEKTQHIQLLHTTRFWNRLRYNYYTNTAEARLNERVDRFGGKYVEFYGDAGITDDQIEAGKSQVNSPADWSEYMIEAMIYHLRERETPVMDLPRMFVVLDYVPEMTPFTAAKTVTIPPYKCVFANYYHVNKNNLTEVKNAGDTDQYKEPLPSPRDSEPAYDVSEMAFWIYLSLVPLIDGDPEYDPSKAASLIAQGAEAL
ncbi:hypothetical protein OB920_07705 [Halobacteria archaeon HArc-gm2]|nr:hypothetical protein [Halobacteria archaeon HArc-gm2]